MLAYQPRYRRLTTLLLLCAPLVLGTSGCTLAAIHMINKMNDDKSNTEQTVDQPTDQATEQESDTNKVAPTPKSTV